MIVVCDVFSSRLCGPYYCGKRMSDGTLIVWRKSAKKRLVAKLLL